MNYKKIISDGYILGIGQTEAEGNITEAEYTALLEVFAAKPEAPEGKVYLLRTDLSWELVETEDEEPTDPEVSADEALSIITGEVTE